VPERVLIVEDDDAIAMVLEDLLIGEGFEVRRAPNGRIGLELLEQFLPNVVLLDLMMPVLDGWGFRAEQTRMRPELARIPIVVLSGARDATAAAADLNAAAAVIKPFAIDPLAEAVRSAIKS
jgi:two-component system chemotaxis response regulator CheY